MNFDRQFNHYVLQVQPEHQQLNQVPLLQVQPKQRLQHQQLLLRQLHQLQEV